MSIESVIVPKPFMFNALKHHRKYVLQFVLRDQLKERMDLHTAAEKLKEIGSNLIMDFYTGHLTPQEVCEDIQERLLQRNLFKEGDYRRYIERTEKKYRNIEISDQSRWTLLLGREKGRYVHIHPARYSKHTVRIKGIPLKTAILMMLSKPDLHGEAFLNQMNYIRSEILYESPVGRSGDTKNTKRIMNALYEESHYTDLKWNDAVKHPRT